MEEKGFILSTTFYEKQISFEFQSGVFVAPVCSLRSTYRLNVESPESLKRLIKDHSVSLNV